MDKILDGLSETLKGMKVIELASVLAGPSVGMFLAELGAEVLKIENPATNGDVTRSWKLSSENAEESRSAYFSSVNWGKESILLNLAEGDALRQLHQLISEADILLTSFKKGDAKKFGLDPDEILKAHPSLIYASIVGYSGSDDRVAYDAAIQAESGWWYINGEQNGSGHKLPVAVVDVFAGHQLKQGILAAIIGRIKTGKGCHVVVSLYDAAISALVNQASNWMNAGFDPRPMGSEHPNIAPYGNSFVCKDGKKIMLAVGSDKQFKAMCAILEIVPEPDLFASNKLRVMNRGKLREVLGQAFKRFESNLLLEQFYQRSIPCAEVKPISDALKNAPDNLFLRDEGVIGIRQAVFSTSRDLSAPPVFEKKQD